MSLAGLSLLVLAATIGGFAISKLIDWLDSLN